jgi:serine/threonine-protein kinase
MSQPPRDESDTVKQSAAADGDSAAGPAPPADAGASGPVPDIRTAGDELPHISGDLAPPGQTDAGGTSDVAGGPAGGTTDFVLQGGLPRSEPGDSGSATPYGTTDFLLADPHRATGGPAGDETGGGADRTVEERGLPGTVAGYQIFGVLGRGAMGVVYKARQRGLKRVVALKMILAGAHATAADLARFKAEAEAVARLQHPNIVQIYEVGEEQGRPFFSLEFVDGTSLARKIAGTPQPDRAAAETLLALARGMDYAHRAGVVHRDLKPANVLLTRDGVPKISDFGLAKQVEEDSGQTRPGTVLGTPSYMAPEQAHGRTRDVGPHSDVYGLGAILYELLTGRAPFRAATVLETLRQVCHEEPVPPGLLRPGAPRDLETICLKCLHKEPTRRYPSAADLADDLERYLKGEPVRARPIGRLERLARWCRRNPGVAGLTGAVALLLVAIALGALAFAWQVRRQNELLNAKNAELERSNQAKEEARQAALANAKEARDKHTQAYSHMVELGRRVYTHVLQRQLRAGDSYPELRGLRDEIVNDLATSLVQMARELEPSGVTPFSRAGGLTALGDVLARSFGLKKEGLNQYEKARVLLEGIAQAEPTNDRARANLALLLSRIAEVGPQLAGDLGKARELAGRAIALQQEVAANPHGDAYGPKDNRRLLAQYYLLRGQLGLSQGDPAAAGEDLAEAVRLRREWNKMTPDEPADPKRSVTSWLSEAYLWQGTAAWHRGNAGASDAALAKALAICEDLYGQIPRSVGYNEDLAVVYRACGDSRLHRDQPAEAERYYRQALEKIRFALQGDPSSVYRRHLLASLHDRLGTALAAQPGQAEEAGRSFELARQVRAVLLRDVRGDLGEQVAQARTLARCGRLGEAAKEAGELRRQVSNNVELLVGLACCYARCAASSEGVPRQKYAGQALAALREATRLGYRDAVVLRTEPDLEAVRADPAFRELLDGAKAR